MTLGLAFACQEVERVPDEQHDVPLDAIATERELILPGRRLMRLLFLGDVVGRTGRNAVIERLPGLRERWRLDAVVINGENAAGGFGLTEAIYDELMAAGADVITLGNHAFDQREALVFIERAPVCVRPVNYPAGTPGRGATLVETPARARVLVVKVMGRVFMDAMDDPFTRDRARARRLPARRAADASLVDFHAEATSEKQALGHLVDGRASLVVGTHTHVPTADHRSWPAAPPIMSDAGMCGDYDQRHRHGQGGADPPLHPQDPAARFEPASGEATLCGIAVETDDATGLAGAIAPVRLGGRLNRRWPTFWE